ncbi:MAG: tRNA (adenosine(37)-N6)-threonylcarbamoyltransferase complex dimerization subunit type 1 TsaB [Chloroflexota bacterium]|nr:tRNA (adenosine(37)-N6)-threonylcarbamoyltransferase complex dimerization subunit type 1 TsaB [Chloroflexota bacterium]
MFLALDTATEHAGVALLNKAGHVIHEKNWLSNRNHTSELHLAIESALVESAIGINDIKGLIVTIGPGSFTGIRIGLAAAKAISISLDIPVVGISTLDVAAFPFINQRDQIISLLPAGRGEFSCAVFRNDENDSSILAPYKKIIEDHIITVDELFSFIDEQKGPMIICGEITDDLEDRLVQINNTIIHIPPIPERQRRSGELARLGYRRFTQGLMDDPTKLQPVYLRKSAAEENLEKK